MKLTRCDAGDRNSGSGKLKVESGGHKSDGSKSIKLTQQFRNYFLLLTLTR